MALQAAIEFVIGYLSGKLGDAVPIGVLAVVMPMLLKVAEVDRFDAEARANMQATIDDALRRIGAI